MNPIQKKIMNQRGQITNFITAGILFVVLVSIIAFGLSLQSNFTTLTGQTVPFSALWPQVVMGFAIIGLLIGVAALVKNALSG